jgi:FAD dependent oxidoreductase
VQFKTKSNRMKTKLVILIHLLISSSYLFSKDAESAADVIIYGGTSAAITAAVQTVRMHKSVIVVSPDKHIGGLSSSGLGFTDTGDKSVIGGLSKEFYQRVYQHYQQPENWKWQKREQYGNRGQCTPAMDGESKSMWIFEPHTAEGIFEDFVKEYKINVVRNEWLNREKGVKKQNGKIISITTLSGHTYKGKQFIDATYEGDLLAAAGVSYTVGREACSMYDEKWNGVQPNNFQHVHNFGKMNVSPYKIAGDPKSGLLPNISADEVGNPCDGDKKVQAYCFRLCLTKVDDNKLPITRPEKYDSTQYELLLRAMYAGWTDHFNFGPVPNFKTDCNNQGPFSFDYIGMNYDYPEASYEKRNEIVKDHERYQKGLLYFLATDYRVPAGIQIEMKKWGYAKDEFTDNNGWPYLLYIREARRMVGMTVLTENELMGKKPVENSIGMGSYTMDSHNVQRYVTPEGYAQNEGDIGVHLHSPYEIPMGSLLPKEKECTNLTVAVAVSTSHIAYGSVRMEPVFMILGQSAATIAVLAMDRKTNVQKVNYQELKKELLKGNQILSLPEKK